MASDFVDASLVKESVRASASLPSTPATLSSSVIDWFLKWERKEVFFRRRSHPTDLAYTSAFEPHVEYVSVITKLLGCHIKFVDKEISADTGEIGASEEDIYVPPGYWQTFRIEPGKFRLEALILEPRQNHDPFFQVCERY